MAKIYCLLTLFNIFVLYLFMYAKIYDMVLSSRFNLWYQPHIQQAGAKKGQILAVRLLMDVARKSKLTLYVLFVDLVKAYDRVNREKLIKRMDDLGCGSHFL